MRILIADDDQDIRCILKSILAKNGFEIIEAANGAEAVELFLKFIPPIVLMDVEMPKMDGIEATRRITQINPETVIIGITANTDRKHDLLRAGAKDVLAKPFSGKVLVDLMRKYLSPGGECPMLNPQDFKKIVDESLAGVCILDLDGRIFYVNDIFAAVTKYSKEELKKMNILDLIHEEDRQKMAEKLKRASEEKVFYEGRYMTKDGEIRWAYCFSKLIEVNGEKYVLINCLDITREKEIEEKLRESELFFSKLVEESIAPVYIIRDRLLYVNKAVEDLTGYTRDELLSMDPINQLVHPEDRELVGGRFKERLEGRRDTETYSFRIISKDGRVRWVTIRPSRVIYQGKPAVCATVLDITDIQELNEKLRAREEFLKLLNRILRHDIANALTPIIVALEDMDEKMVEIARTKVRDIVKLIQIVKGMESGTEEVRPVRLDEIARRIAESTGVRFEGEEVKVLANDSVGIIIQNLVENALVHGKEGVKVEVAKVDFKGILRVSDRGEGIPDEIKEKIFKAGFSTKNRTGLGLYIVKKLVDILGGEIRVYDNKPRGAVFEVILKAV